MEEYDVDTFLTIFFGIFEQTNFREVNPSSPVERDRSLLLVIAKTARVARMIKSSTVVEISSKVNFYWYFERLTPSWYYQKYLEKREKARRLAEENDAGRKKTSWSALELAAIAAVKQKAQEEKIQRQLQRSPYKRVVRFLLRSFGMLPNKMVELQRQIAATKIQRAWRNTHARPVYAASEDGGSVDFDELPRGRTAPTGALDRVLKKRSMMGHLGFSSRRTNNTDSDPMRESFGRKQSSRKARPTRKQESRMIQQDSRPESQVGSAMGELTGQRVATGIFFSLILTILFTYQEMDTTRHTTMVVLHSQILRNPTYNNANRALSAARRNSDLLQDMYRYNGGSDDLLFDFDVGRDPSSLRARERLRITVEDSRGQTEGFFDYRTVRTNQAKVQLASTFFVLIIWFLGVAAFAGPVMTLVIIPIERMVRLLGMLVLDPLGYQSTSRFKKFMVEEDALVKKSQWTKEVLKGMETTFLMSTILRIGSLMKVGFGSAGVEIIRTYLQIGQNKNQLQLNSQGVTVSCIFLFCDIRQFTDATECLQEEVFVFTNRIAAVVHSFCHSLGGSANKNVGDAFLVSWLLEDEATGSKNRFVASRNAAAKKHKADKALLSVIRICMALQYDKYYIETMSETARNKLLAKLRKRPGPVVQMGFGLHAGKAAQCAIGSERKIDATYVSEAVERAELLESSTKKYGLKMLMSDSFHKLLHPSNRRRCRKIDQIIFPDEEDDETETDEITGEIMELYTYDMDIEALWQKQKTQHQGFEGEDETSESESGPGAGGSKRGFKAHSQQGQSGRPFLSTSRRFRSTRRFDDSKASEEFRVGATAEKDFQPNVSITNDATKNDEVNQSSPGELVLPTGPALYSSNVWLSEDMRTIRQRFTHVIFQRFSSGLQAYYSKDWKTARENFSAVLEYFEDGPSRYFVNEIDKHKGVPPRDFNGYGRA
jgi:class 3 adenylate cyclase